MSLSSAETGPTRPVVDVRAFARRHWPLAVGLVVLALVLGWQQLGADGEPAAQPAPVLVEREPAPPPEPTPKRDPLSGFAKPLAPVAQALVGAVYEDRAELTRRVNELLGQGLNDCKVFIGSDGVSWSVSAVWSAGHPSPVFAGCPFPPAATP